MTEKDVTRRVAFADAAHMQELEQEFTALERRFGYLPNSLKIVARKPAIAKALINLGRTVLLEEDRVSNSLKWLAANASSLASGCRYCQAHTAKNAHEADVPIEKVENIALFETNPVFSDAERAVIALGFAAGAVPNGVTSDHFVELRKHFDEDQIVEIVSAIAIFGWFNRWNDTFASDLEEGPLAFGADHLSATAGWTPGRHKA